MGDTYDGNNFWTTQPNGQKAPTPLFLALAVIELSDVVFAVDSIPAVSALGCCVVLDVKLVVHPQQLDAGGSVFMASACMATVATS